ncbi:MAG: hypothetical protein WA419_13465 [Silvibacterium sp.]
MTLAAKETSGKAIPAFLQRLAADPRVTVRREGAALEGGKCILYWMQRAERSLDNPAVNLFARK